MDCFVISKTHTLLKNYSVSSVLKDKSGGYWFSTLENGVFYTLSLGINHWDNHNGLYKKEVIKVNVHEKHLVVLSLSGYHFFHSTGNHFYKRADSKPLNIWINGQNEMMVGGYQPLKFGADGAISCMEDHTSFYNHLPSKNGFYFLGIDAIVERNKSGNDTIYRFYKKNGFGGRFDVNTIIEVAKDTYYCSSSSGLYLLKNQSIQRIQPKDKRHETRIIHMLQDKRLGIVVATRGIGVYLMKNNRIWKHINKSDGLIDDNLTDIHIDQKDDLYCSSYKGISRIRFEHNQPKITNLNKFHGLVSNEVESISSDEEQLWLGTKSGLVSIPFAFFDQKSTKPKLIFESVSVNDQLSDEKQTLQLDERKLTLKLNFRSSEYRNFDQQKFRYRFSKSEKWIYTDKSSVVLTHPQSDDYSFEVAHGDLQAFGNHHKN